MPDFSGSLKELRLWFRVSEGEEMEDDRRFGSAKSPVQKTSSSLSSSPEPEMMSADVGGEKTLRNRSEEVVRRCVRRLRVLFGSMDKIIPAIVLILIKRCGRVKTRLSVALVNLLELFFESNLLELDAPTLCK